MTKTQAYSMEKILAAQDVLRNLPTKEKEHSKSEVVEFLKTDLRKAVKQGHSLKDIQAILAEQGISVSLSGMEAVLGQSGKVSARKKAESGKPSPKEGTAISDEVTNRERETVNPDAQNPTPAQQVDEDDVPSSYRPDTKEF